MKAEFHVEKHGVGMSNFSIEKKGYNVSEVDAYVDDLEAKITHLQARNSELEQKLATAKRLIRRFSDTENALKQNIADSKRAAAYMISDARERSAALLDETRESCGEIISDLDMQISERMNTINLMRAEVSAFKDELFSLYSSHIELIDTLANTAENFRYEPDYTPVADSVDKFEEAGEPDCEVPGFIEYPEESIFSELEEEKEPEGEFNMEAVAEGVVAEGSEKEVAFDQISLDGFSENGTDDDDEGDEGDEVFDITPEEFDSVEEVDIDMAYNSSESEEVAEDEPSEEKKDDSVYFKFLSDFANSDEDAN